MHRGDQVRLIQSSRTGRVNSYRPVNGNVSVHWDGMKAKTIHPVRFLRSVDSDPSDDPPSVFSGRYLRYHGRDFAIYNGKLQAA